MKLKCTINEIEYDIVNGATFSEEYNETLDSGNIIIEGVSKMEDIRPFDDVFIYDTDSTFNGYKSRASDFIEVETTLYQSLNYISISKLQLDYIYENKTRERGGLLLRYIKDGTTYETFCGLNYSDDVYSLYFVDTPETTYTLVESFNTLRLYYSSFADIAYFEYFTFKVTAEDVEMPTFYKHLLVDSVVEERLNPTGDLYKYKITLFSETKRLERIQLPNISITQPIDISLRKSVADYIKQYVELYSPSIKVSTTPYGYGYSNYVYMYLNKYEVDSSIDDIFGDVYCPNFSLDNPSLRTLLNQLFLVKDRIPYVKDDIIYALDISERTTTFSLDGMVNIVSSRSSENHSTGLKRTYKDALSSKNTARMVEYIGFRNSDNALLTLENMRVETKFPIYKINKIYMCYYKKAQIWTTEEGTATYTGEDKVFLCKQDITKLVKLDEEKATLSKDWNQFENEMPQTMDELAEYKLCTLSYSIGSNKIEGWGTTYEYPSGWWGTTTATQSYIYNIFKAVEKINKWGIYTAGYLAKDLEAGQYITISDEEEDILDNLVTPFTNDTQKLKSFFFMVDYEAFYNGTIVTSKDNEDRDDIITNDNQSASLTLLEKDGLFQKEKANRFGNKAYSYNAIYDDISSLQDLGSVDSSIDDDVIIYHREYSIYDNYVKASYYGTKDYVLKNYFTSVYAKHRPFNLLSYSQSTIRAENRKLNLLLSKEKCYYEQTNSDYNLLPQMFFENFNNYLLSLISFPKPSITPTDVDRFQQPNKLNYGYVEYNGNKYSNDINIFTSGYSLCMNISMWDNITMGNYISDLIPTSTSVTEDVVGSVQSFYSVVDSVETGFTETIGFYFVHTPEDAFSDIVIDYEDGIEDTLYDKLCALPKIESTEETNIIGKDYTLYKDNKEVIDMTFQIEPYTNDEDIIFSEWIMKLCDLYGVYNKFANNVVVYDSNGYSVGIPTYCSTIHWQTTLESNTLDYYRPVVTFIISQSDFANLTAGTKFFMTYDWSISLYDTLWNQHTPWDDVIVGLSLTINFIKSISEDEIEFYGFIVKKVRKGWFGGTQDVPEDYIFKVQRVTELAQIDYSNDTENYYFSNVVNDADSDSTFKQISLNSSDLNVYNMEFKDRNDSVEEYTASWNSSNYSEIASNYVNELVTPKTYYKNMFISIHGVNLDKTLVYDEYAEGERTFISIDFESVITIKNDELEAENSSLPKTYIYIDLSTLETYSPKAISIWYSEREDDSVQSGTLHFVFGVNISDEDWENGYIKIYASLINRKDTRIFDTNNKVIGEIVNYEDEDTTQNYGVKQYFVLK